MWCGSSSCLFSCFSVHTMETLKYLQECQMFMIQIKTRIKQKNRSVMLRRCHVIGPEQETSATNGKLDVCKKCMVCESLQIFFWGRRGGIHLGKWKKHWANAVLESLLWMVIAVSFGSKEHPPAQSQLWTLWTQSTLTLASSCDVNYM